MRDKERIFYIVLLFITLIVLFYKNKNIETYTIVKTIPADTVYSTVVSIKPEISLKYKYKTDTLWLHDTVFSEVDTFAIIEEFFTMNEYNDTIKDDSSMTIVRNISITQNKIFEEEYFVKNNRISVLAINKCNDKYFSLGGIIGSDILAPTIGYGFGKNEMGLGYNMNGSKGFLAFYKYKFNKK